MSSIDTSTSMTPDFSKMSLGRCHGRPRKPLQAPDTDDYPLVGASQEEINKYVKKKTTELWRFKKLSSSNSAEYRAAENKRVKDYQKNKKQEKERKSCESTDEHQKQLSRERYVKYT